MGGRKTPGVPQFDPSGHYTGEANAGLKKPEFRQTAFSESGKKVRFYNVLIIL
jgi:hypothetical protein